MSAFVLKAKRCGGKIRKKNLKKIPSYLKFATSAVAASTSSAFPLIWSEPSTNQLFGNSFWIKLRGHSDNVRDTTKHLISLTVCSRALS